jgi:hypothetical protein
VRGLLYACVAVLTVYLQLPGVKLVGEWHRLLGTIANIGKIVSKPEVAQEEENTDDAACDGATDLDPHVKLA